MPQLLEYLQLHHLIHCDIKPRNIRLCPTDCRFVLVDFGIVKDIAATTSRHDLDSMAVGTPGFAPPEQLANRTKFASDLYARNYGHISIENTPSPLATVEIGAVLPLLSSGGLWG